MLIILGILAAVALGGIIYLYVSPKSTKIQKMAALGALGLSGLVILICGILLVLGGGVGEGNDPYAFPTTVVETPKPSSNARVSELIVFLVVLLLVFGFVVFLAIRDQKKKSQNKIQTKNTSADKAKKDDDSDFSFDE
jgi:flagellar basal body-associated protein FliL